MIGLTDAGTAHLEVLTTRPTIRNRAEAGCLARGAPAYRETNPYCETPRSSVAIFPIDSPGKGI